MATRKIKDAYVGNEPVYFSSSAQATYMSDGQTVEQAVAGKVDIVEGKQLSTEDFTTVLKEKLDGWAPDEYVTKDELDKILQDSPFEFVDLGLPSGTLWATCNIGADNPEDAGLYFAWGETEGYKVTYTTEGDTVTSTTIMDEDGNETDRKFTSAYYKWCDGGYNELTKYNSNPDYGTVDNLSKLVLVDDAVYIRDRDGRIPSVADFEELIAHTTFSRVAIGNQGCGKFTAANGNYVIFPAVGRVIEGISFVNIAALYSTRELSDSDTRDRGIMTFTSSYAPAIDSDGRGVGLPVRAVKNALYGNDDHYYTKEEIDVKEQNTLYAIEGKQDVISDLDNIRSGAVLGATSIQSHQDISHLATKSEISDMLTKTEAGETYQPKGDYAEKGDIITTTEGDGTKYLADDGTYKEVDALPEGGTAGQVLTKTEEGAEWSDPSSGAGFVAQTDEPEDTSLLWVDTDDTTDETDSIIGVDAYMSDTSVNPVQNAVVKQYIDSRMVAVTEAEYEALGDSVNSDGVLYLITE